MLATLVFHFLHFKYLKKFKMLKSRHFFVNRDDAEVRLFSNKTDGIFSSPEFIFKTTEDDGRSVDSTILHRQIGYVTLASETLRGTFDIVDGDPFGVFEIDRDTGLISTQKSVDRERQAEYRLKVVVAVLGTKTFSECLVRIDIDDINDVIPSFTSNDNNVVFADGDAAIGQPLHRVEVEDGDLGENGRIGFTLEDKSGYFSIDPNQGNECLGHRAPQSVRHRFRQTRCDDFFQVTSDHF
jgi:hypothetical protein